MNSIKEDIDNLFQKLKESNNYKNYLKVVKDMESTKEIVSLIKEIKRLQKIYANEKDKNVNKKLCVLKDKLNSYPIYQSYLIIKDELNNELFEIKDIFEKYFKDVLEINH